MNSDDQHEFQETIIDRLQEKGAEIYHAYVEGGLEYNELTEDALRNYVEALIETLDVHANSSLQQINSMLRSASFSLSDIDGAGASEEFDERPDYDSLIDEIIELYEERFGEAYECTERNERRSPAERAIENRPTDRSQSTAVRNSRTDEFGTGSDQFFPDWINVKTVAGTAGVILLVGGVAWYYQR